MSPIAAIRLVFFLDGLIIAKWLPHLPDLQAHLGLSVTSLGLALAALPVGIVCSLPLVGTVIISRVSERAAIRLTFAWLAFTSMLPGLAWDLPSFAAALFFYGSGIAGVEVSMNATADAIEYRTKTRIMSSCHGLWSVGNLGGAAIGSLFLFWHLGANVTLTVAAPVLFVIAWIATGRLNLAPISPVPGPALALPNRALLILCILPFCACILEGAMADWAAVYLRLEHGAEAALTGAGFGTFALIMASTRLGGDRLIDRWGPVLLARACGIAGIIGLLLIYLAPDVWVALLGFGFMGLAASLIFPISVSAAARVPGRAPAMNIAALSLICFSGYVIGPPIVGLIAGVVGLKAALLCLIPFAIGIVLLARRVEPTGERTREAAGAVAD